ncbi:MAG TPA: helix-turn-helix domain-containing protein [Paludibacter sp.]|nr:helix-turn-helix domain-containing protein [Paludibacter sp.]
MFLKYITLISGFNYLLFSTVLLLKKKPLRKDNQVLGFLFLIMGVYSILLSFYNSALLEKNYSFLAYYVPIDYALITLIAPFIYFYIKTLLNKPVTVRSWKFWIHAISILPALGFNLYFLSLTRMERIDLLILSFKEGVFSFTILNIIFYIQMTLYLFICYRIITNQLKVSAKVLQGATLVDVSWLKTLMIIDLIVMFVSAPLCFYFANEQTSNIIAQLAMNIQLVYIFLKSTWQTGIFPGENISEAKPKDPTLKIADDVVEDYFKTLMTFMQDKKPYLQEDCNIQTVAEQTSISVHHLSNILNQRFDKNFPDFINEYRINEAMRILNSDQSSKMTLEAIGYECGFGSKSSFNKAFKKLTNSTPSRYRLRSKS